MSHIFRNCTNRSISSALLLITISGKHGLLSISECQQELVCGTDHSSNLQRIYQIVTDPKVREIDAVILVMLYALRYVYKI